MKIISTFQKPLIIFCTAIVFLSLFSTGIFLSAHKPLWTDEIHTTTNTLKHASYLDVLKGNLPGEANNFPLYYLSQKFITDITDYEFTQHWEGEHFLFDQKGQIILRLPSIIFISSALTLIFFFFLGSGQAFSGFAALLLALSSVMTWAYWAEARPYALWYSLTFLHAVLIYRSVTKKNTPIRALTLIHWLLALTSVISLGQALITSIALLIIKKISWKKFLILCSPIPVILFFHSTGLSARPILTQNPFYLLFIAVPVEWIIILLINFIFILRKPNLYENLRYQKTFYLLVSGMFLIAGGIFLLSFLSHSSQGAYLDYRHFIFLTPYAIVLISQIFNQVWQKFSTTTWGAVNTVLLLLTFIIFSGVQTALRLYESVVYLW